MRLVILADEERSGRIHIDPVHDPGTHDPVDAGQLIPAVIHNRIDKRMLIMSRRRMDNHSLRLIDHKDVIVFIKDIQRDIFRTDVRDFRFGNKDADRLALLLERFLTTEDIERATASIQVLVPTIHNKYQKELAEQEKRVEEKQAQLDEINEEIDSILGINTKDVVTRKSRRKADTASVTAVSKKQSSGTATGAGRRRSGVPQGRVFSEADRPK